MDTSNLRVAKANELILGGVWYRKNTDGTFSTVIMEMPKKEHTQKEFRKIVQQLSKSEKIYVRKDKPNFPLTEVLEFETQLRIEKNANRK